jgi:prolyl oligopeptidase
MTQFFAAPRVPRYRSTSVPPKSGALMLVALGLSVLSLVAMPLVTPCACAPPPLTYPDTPRIPVADTLHGTVLVDDYRWLENAADPRVRSWDEAQSTLARRFLDDLPQRAPFRARLDTLSRYDDETTPDPVPEGTRVFYWVKRKDQEKRSYWWKENPTAKGRLLLDPNEWKAEDQLAGTWPSRDGRLLAFGRAHGGDENPVIRVMDIDTGRLLPDTLRGWRQEGVSWLPGNTGFFYSCQPKAGEVPAGEEYYWFSSWRHRLGEPAAQDVKVFGSDTVKELFHNAGVTEDGRWVLFYRSSFYTNEVYFRPADSDEPPRPLVTGLDAQYAVDEVEGKFLIRTDRDAPRYRAWITEVDRPGRENWREFLPEDPKDKLSYLAPIGGHIYAVYEHNATTRVRIHDLAGAFLRELPFPAPGEGNVSGLWGHPEVWVTFRSFTHPPASYRYDFAGDRLDVYRAFPVKIDTTPYATEQVWYPSKDGTQVSMFIVHRKDLVKDGRHPLLLTGYGGFDVSMNPYFSGSVFLWLEAGGIFAMPNLRGGGEYGKAWHEAGMKEKKQKVFDDFIGAAEWLIANGYTSPEKLAISGGSNGGLLVGAALVQRPELFRAVNCAVPLLDMVRYHRFGLANIWAEEYGSAEDAAQFKYLLDYSPYHHVVDGTNYPAVLLTGSENDARVDPLHARKMAAKLQAADPHGRPILFLLLRSSGHIGGTTLTVQLDQAADDYAFLMSQLGM